MILPIPSSLQSPIKSTRTWISTPKYKRRDHWESYSHLPSVPKSLTLVIVLFWDKTKLQTTVLLRVGKGGLWESLQAHTQIKTIHHTLCKSPKPIRTAQHLYSSLLTWTIKIPQKNVRKIWLFFFLRARQPQVISTGMDLRDYRLL